MRPPCWPVDHTEPPNPCALERYDRIVYNRQHLPEPWAGWRFAGRVLISPEGDRISPERLRGILWTEAQTARTAARRTEQERVCRVASGLRDRVSRLVRRGPN